MLQLFSLISDGPGSLCHLHLQRLDEHLSNLRPNFDEVCLQEERLDSPTMLMLISQNMSKNGGSWSKKPKSC